jgi:hypothetical protein
MDEAQQQLWKDFEKDSTTSSKFFKPEFGVGYKVVFASAKLERKAFNPGDEEKWHGDLTLKFLDGKPCSLIFGTGSISILKSVKKPNDEGKLDTIVWLLKKMKQGDNTRYIFEEIGAISSSPSKEVPFA